MVLRTAKLRLLQRFNLEQIETAALGSRTLRDASYPRWVKSDVSDPNRQLSALASVATKFATYRAIAKYQ